MNEIQIFDGRDIPQFWNPDFPEDHGPAQEYLESRGRRHDDVAHACRTILEAIKFTRSNLYGINLRVIDDFDRDSICNIRLELGSLNELAFTDLSMPSAIKWVQDYVDTLDHLIMLMGIRYHEWKQERINGGVQKDRFEGIEGYTFQCHDLYLTSLDDDIFEKDEILIARCQMVRRDHHHELQQMALPKQLKTLCILECSGNRSWTMTYIKRARILSVFTNPHDPDGYTTLYIDCQKSVKTAYGRGNKPNPTRLKSWTGSSHERDVIARVVKSARSCWSAREAILRAR